MQRRDFFKVFGLPVVGWAGFKLAGCGAETRASALQQDSASLPASLSIWSYYVPLTSYQGVVEDFEGRDPLDLKVDFSAVAARTSRISGRRTDGTDNRQRFVVAELRESSAEFVRVRFWHDDNDPEGEEGHTLYIFRRHLLALEAGEKIFVATGLFQENHYHVVMIDPREGRSAV